MTMGDQLARQVDEVTVTDEQHAKFLAILVEDKMTGDARALRQAGVAGTTGQLRAYAKEHLAEDAREARGWSLTKVENCTWEVAMNTEHPSWDRANARVLKAYHPAYRDQTHVEHTGAGGTPLAVTVEHDYGRLLDKLADAGLLQPRPSDVADTAGQRLLPARTD